MEYRSWNEDSSQEAQEVKKQASKGPTAASGEVQDHLFSLLKLDLPNLAELRTFLAESSLIFRPSLS
jgi:hypothetical protein